MDIRNQGAVGHMSLLYLLKVLKSNIVIILVVALLCGGAAGVFRYVSTEVTYTSEVSFFVSGYAINGTGQKYVTSSSSGTALALTKSYVQIMKQNVLLGKVQQRVLENAGLSFMHRELASMMSVSCVEEEMLIYVKVTHENQDVAYEVAKAIEGKQIVKTILVKNKLVNLIVK